jgi:hypothetical protein
VIFDGDADFASSSMTTPLSYTVGPSSGRQS